MQDANIKKLKKGTYISSPIVVIGIILVIIGSFTGISISIIGLAVITWGLLLFFIYLSQTWIRDVKDKNDHKVEVDIEAGLNSNVNKILKQIDEKKEEKKKPKINIKFSRKNDL